MKTKLRTILLDLLVSGWAFFQAKPSEGNNNVRIEVHSPLNTFIDRNPNSPYVKDSYRAVIRRWMTEQQILNQFGKKLTSQERADLKETCKNTFENTGAWYIRGYYDNNGYPLTDGLRAGEEPTVPGYPDSNRWYRNNLIPVYEIEWTETDKNFVM